MFYESLKNRISGVIALEFIIIFPVFFLLVFGGIEIYWMLHVRHIMSVAAEEGTRAMAYNCVSDEEAVNITQQYLSLTLTRLNANFEISTEQNPEQATVKIIVPLQEILLIGLYRLCVFPDETLSVKSTMYKNPLCNQLL